MGLVSTVNSRVKKEARRVTDQIRPAEGRGYGLSGGFVDEGGLEGNGLAEGRELGEGVIGTRVPIRKQADGIESRVEDQCPGVFRRSKEDEETHAEMLRRAEQHFRPHPSLPFRQFSEPAEIVKVSQAFTVRDGVHAKRRDGPVKIHNIKTTTLERRHYSVQVRYLLKSTVGTCLEPSSALKKGLS